MNKALFSSEKMDWGTPQTLFDALDEEFDFVLDPASSHENAKCKRHFTPAEDGLAQSWAGGAVFCNPPYGRTLHKWVEKAYTEHQKHGNTVVLLIPARPDTSYWHDFILHGKAHEIRFLRGRLYFTDEQGREVGRAPFPSAVVIYKR